MPFWGKKKHTEVEDTSNDQTDDGKLLSSMGSIPIAKLHRKAGISSETSSPRKNVVETTDENVEPNVNMIEKPKKRKLECDVDITQIIEEFDIEGDSALFRH